jgi:microcystin-dependent protein
MPSEPYVGEIKMFGGNFAPLGWALCEGQLLPISENETLFNLIGTTYGGDGQSTFALPDLRGRIPIHQGDGFILAETPGVESVTLTLNQIPAHTHPQVASLAASSHATPVGYVTADTTLVGASIYAPLSAPVPLAPGVVTAVGASQPHENRMPYLAVTFIISLFGIFPPQN